MPCIFVLYFVFTKTCQKINVICMLMDAYFKQILPPVRLSTRIVVHGRHGIGSKNCQDCNRKNSLFWKNSNECQCFIFDFSVLPVNRKILYQEMQQFFSLTFEDAFLFVQAASTFLSSLSVPISSLVTIFPSSFLSQRIVLFSIPSTDSFLSLSSSLLYSIAASRTTLNVTIFDVSIKLVVFH